MIYLDYQATTPLAPAAFTAMVPWLRDDFANPHSAHAAGRKAKAAVEVARALVAALLPPGGRVVFTSGATEALNWAIKGVCGDMVTLASEHAAVLDTARSQRGGAARVVEIGPDGLVDPAALDLTGAALVEAMLVNNEIGVIQPIAEIAARAHAAGALFLCDAVQGYGRLPIPDGCDLIAISAHKIHGPKGIGALWVRDGVEIAPLLHGGDQEGGRSGTLSPALCVGFGVAARLARELGSTDAAHVDRMFTLAWQRFEAAGWMLNGSAEHRYRGNLNVRCEGLDVARLMSTLRDIAFSAGSACASGSGRSSHVLRAIGLDEAQARASIRIGFGRYTKEEDLIDATDRIIAAAAAQRFAA